MTTRTILTALGAAAVVAAGAATGAPSASAEGVTYYNCHTGHLCFYKKANFNNARSTVDPRVKPDADYYRCGTYNLQGWTQRDGSYMNNQYGRVTTTYWSGRDGHGRVIRRDRIFYTEVPHFNFFPVNSVTVC